MLSERIAKRVGSEEWVILMGQWINFKLVGNYNKIIRINFLI